MQTKISIEQWHDLAEPEKETIRKWAVMEGLGLDIIPHRNGATCDYAALLTIEQMKLFLDEKWNESVSPEEEKSDTCNSLWQDIKNRLQSS